MAQINEATELPDVEPTTRGIDVHATPAAFGGAIAEGIESAGAEANKFGAFYDEVSADHAVNNLYPQYKTILNGDPNDPNTPGYLQLKGGDALGDAYKQVGQQLDNVEKEQRASLGSARAQLAFDRESQRMRYSINQQVSAHYEQQYNTWQLKTNEDLGQNAKDMVAQDPDNPVVMSTALTNARQAAIQIAQLTRGKNFDAGIEIEKADQGVRLAQLDAYLVKDPDKAWDLLNSDGGKSLRSLPNYSALYKQVETEHLNVRSAALGDQNLAKWNGQAAASVQPPAELPKHSIAAPTEYNDALNSVDLKYRGPIGLTLAGETSPTTRNAVNASGHAGVGQFSVDQWKTVTGQTIAPGDVGVQGKDPRLDPNASIRTMGVEFKQNRDAYFNTFGREPTAGDLALMHQQGRAGAFRLFHALADNKPNDLASNYISTAALTQNNIPANATVGQAVRSIADYYVKGQGGSFGGAGATGQYMSQSDYLQSHLNDAVNEFAAQLADDPAYVNRPDLLDAAVQRYEIRYRRRITDQSHDEQVGARQTLILIHDNGFTSDNDVLASSPQNAAILMNTLAAKPDFRLALDSMYKANSSGHATTNGTQFTSLLDRVLLPANDPHRLSDPSEIARLAGAGENVPLTNTGAHVLQQIAAARGTPQGEADAATLRSFFAAQYPIINPLENKANGTTWHQQEIAYQNFVNSTLKNIDFQKQADPGKSVAELLAPGGDLWNSVIAYKPTRVMINAAIQKKNQVKFNEKTGQPEPQGVTQNPALLNKAQILWQQQAQQEHAAQTFAHLPSDQQTRAQQLFAQLPHEKTARDAEINRLYWLDENALLRPYIKAEVLAQGWAYQKRLGAP